VATQLESGVIQVSPDEVDQAAATSHGGYEQLTISASGFRGERLHSLGDGATDAAVGAVRDVAVTATVTYAGEVEGHGHELANAAWAYRAMDHLP
jgi:hypothetical protein